MILNYRVQVDIQNLLHQIEKMNSDDDSDDSSMTSCW